MKTVKQLMGAIALLIFSGSAFAGPIIVNFQSMADGAYGESAFLPLSLQGDFGVDVDISGVFDGQDAYAYLDARDAGLGVCRDLNARGDAKLNDKNPGRGRNLCQVSSDDNVNTYDGLGEGLVFSINEDITITKVWFNNNHDPDYGMTGDTVVIAGSEYTFSDSDKDAASPVLGWVFEFDGTDGDFFDGDILTIDYFVPGIGSEKEGEEFYISAIAFERVPGDEEKPVPAPSTLALLGLGLAGIAARRRRK